MTIASIPVSWMIQGWLAYCVYTFITMNQPLINAHWMQKRSFVPLFWDNVHHTTARFLPATILGFPVDDYHIAQTISVIFAAVCAIYMHYINFCLLTLDPVLSAAGIKPTPRRALRDLVFRAALATPVVINGLLATAIDLAVTHQIQVAEAAFGVLAAAATGYLPQYSYIITPVAMAVQQYLPSLSSNNISVVDGIGRH